jgi:hypothetical protein
MAPNKSLSLKCHLSISPVKGGTNAPPKKSSNQIKALTNQKMSVKITGTLTQQESTQNTKHTYNA